MSTVLHTRYKPTFQHRNEQNATIIKINTRNENIVIPNHFNMKVDVLNVSNIIYM